MACESGGEFIDTGHKTMLAYAREFNLPVESVIKKAGDERFYFGGQHYTEDEVVAEFREVVVNMQPDLRDRAAIEVQQVVTKGVLGELRQPRYPVYCPADR